MMAIIRRLFKNEVKIYQDIEDLPIYNWWKIHETGSFIWLLHDPKQHITGAQEDKLTEIWAAIYKQFINTFGISKTFRKVLELKREICLYKYRKFIEKNETLQIFIEIAEDKLQEMLNSKTQSLVNKEKVYVEQYLGRRIDEKVVTVKEYYSYLKVLEELTEKKKKVANE